MMYYELYVVKSINFRKGMNDDFWYVNVEEEKELDGYKIPTVKINQKQYDELMKLLRVKVNCDIAVTGADKSLPALIEKISHMKDDLSWIIDSIKELDILTIEDPEMNTILLNIFNITNAVIKNGTTTIIFNRFEEYDEDMG